MKKSVKIVLAESSVVIRNGLLSVLKRLSTLHIEVFEVGGPERLKDVVIWHKPDVLIVNPLFLGLFSLPQLRKEASNANMRCVALQWAISDAALLKHYDELISLYDSAEQISEKLTKMLGQAEEDKRHEALSQREKEVVACVAQGLTNKQIADKLCLSAHTVITHRRNITTKLDIRSTAGLIIYAIVNKLVDVADIKTAEEA